MLVKDRLPDLVGGDYAIPVKRLFQYHDTLLMRAQLYLSILLAVGTLLGLAYWRSGEIEAHYWNLVFLCLPIMWIVYKSNGVFRESRGGRFGVAKIAKAWAITVTLAFLAGFATKTTHEFSRVVIGGWVFIAFGAQVVVFLGPLFLMQKFNIHIRKPIPTLVVGTSDLANYLVTSLSNNNWLPDKVVGVLGTNFDSFENWNLHSSPVLGTAEELENVLVRHKIRRVYIALPLRNSAMIEEIYEKVVEKNIDAIWVPDIFSLNLLNHSVREIAGVPLLSLSESPMSREGKAAVKSVMDFTIATLMLVILSPLMLLVAALIKATSPGPVLFRQERHGWDGRVIKVLKFRSMREDSGAADEVKQAVRNDDRVTTIGRFIRRTSIDELPQLFNVLGGTMSLVGPRPHALQHNQYYADLIKSYMIRHRIKPGMTGLAQVNGFRGETIAVEDMEKRVNLDIDYINNWTIFMDVVILLRTPLSLFSRNVY